MAATLARMMHLLRNNRAEEMASRMRIALTYLWRHGRLPNLTDPTLFTELVQLRKLHDRDPRMPRMADKVAVKAFVAEQLGREWTIPILWSGAALPTCLPWAQPMIVKARHGCNQNAIVRGCPRDWHVAHAASARWMLHDYGQWLDEWLYTQIPRGLLIEPLIDNNGKLPIDYKIYVFGGQATHVQVHLDRAGKHRWVMHDLGWRALAEHAPSVPRPSALPAMVAAAEHLAQGFDFARVDFYQQGAQPLFGEISFYPGSGLDSFDPPALDAVMAQLWLKAAASQYATHDRIYEKPSANQSFPLAAG